MSALFIITQAVLLLYGSTIFGWTDMLYNVRYICYGLIILYGCLISAGLKLRNLRKLDLVALVIFAFAFFSHLYSLDEKLTLQRAWVNLLMYGAVFWGIWIPCRNETAVLRFIKTLIAVWFVYYLANAVFLFVHPANAFNMQLEVSAHTEYKRFTGITGNANAIGNFSAVILPLALWNFRRKKNILNLFLLGAVVFSFFFSFSRNAFICSVIGTSLYLFLSVHQKYRSYLILFAVFLIFLIVFYVDLIAPLLPEREDPSRRG